MREQLRHLGAHRGAVGDEALDRLEARLGKADRLARAVRAYCGTSHADCAPKDPDDEFDLGCSLQPLSAALVEWDGDAA